jgi:hypothetical protein
MEKIQYHPYLVANVCVQGSVSAKFYDAFLLKNGISDLKNPESTSRNHRITDIVLSNYSQPDPHHTVLTLYRPLPWKGARAELYAPDSFDKFFAEFKKDIFKEVLPVLNISEKSVKDIRIARWGHPIPVAIPGLLSEGVLEQAHQPIENKIYFVEQDNWALAAIETCAEEALRWSKVIKGQLG